MRDAHDQPRDENKDAYDDLSTLDIQISDLPPSQRSHVLLLKATALREHTRVRALALLRAIAPRARRDNESESQEDERFALEISDLPPSAPSHYLLLQLRARIRAILPLRQRRTSRQRPSLTRARRRQHIAQALTMLGLCAALVVLLVGNVPDLRARLLSLLRPSVPTPTTSSTLTFGRMGVPIIVARHGLFIGQAQGTPGPLPALCPQASTLQPFLTSLDPPGLGDNPVWITGFVGPTAALVDLHPLGTSLSHPQGQTIGWYERLSLFIQRGLTGTITLRGESQEAGGLVFFAGDDVSNYSLVFRLDLSTLRQYDSPGGSYWQTTSLNLIVPFAGCYTLQATWSTGSWFQFFAAGS